MILLFSFFVFRFRTRILTLTEGFRLSVAIITPTRGFMFIHKVNIVPILTKHGTESFPFDWFFEFPLFVLIVVSNSYDDVFRRSKQFLKPIKKACLTFLCVNETVEFETTIPRIHVMRCYFPIHRVLGFHVFLKLLSF